MKQSPLERRTPLTVKTPLRRTTALGRSPLARSALHADQAGQSGKPTRRTARNTGPSQSVLRLLAARSEGLCEFWQCLDDAAHTHHRRPRRMGGSSAPATNLPSNLLRLCPDHHGWVEANRAHSLELGLLLHAGATPAEVPVWLRYGEVLLADDGSFFPATPEEANRA